MRPKPPPPEPEDLEVLAAAGAIMDEHTRLDMRAVWIDTGPDAPCALCDLRVLHSRDFHYALLPARVRRLTRGYPSKVRLAERAYRKATSRKWPIERALWHEIATEHRTVRELAPVFGVCFATVARWCRLLGIQDLDGEGSDKPHDGNEYEMR